MYRLRGWRSAAALIVLAVVPLAPLWTWRPVTTWVANFHHATCVGPCCLVTDGFVSYRAANICRRRHPRHHQADHPRARRTGGVIARVGCGAYGRDMRLLL